MESNTPGIVGGFKSNFFVCLLVIEFVVALFEAEEEEELVFVVPTTAPVFSIFLFLTTTEEASAAAAAKLLPKPGIWWSRKSPRRSLLTSLRILSSSRDKA
jgi:hypothetical protein